MPGPHMSEKTQFTQRTKEKLRFHSLSPDAAKSADFCQCLLVFWMKQGLRPHG